MRREPTRPTTVLVLSIGFCSLTTSCLDDPVRESRIAALGGETRGVHAGPLHRPGQPCGWCHSEEGGAEGVFSLAGTVYLTPSSLEPLDGATIAFIDSTGAQHRATTNCAGNFYVETSRFAPTWPVWLKVEFSGETSEMRSAIFRETSCGACHADPAGPSTVGHVYFREDAMSMPEGGCK